MSAFNRLVPGPNPNGTVRNPSVSSPLFFRGLDGPGGGCGGGQRDGATSPDGKAWTRWNPGTGATLRKVIASGSKLLAAGDSGAILASPDGTVWQRVATGTTQSLDYLVAGKNGFVAGGGNVFLTSADGSAWTRVPLPDSINYLKSVVWTGAVYMGLCGIRVGLHLSGWHRLDRTGPAGTLPLYRPGPAPGTRLRFRHLGSSGHLRRREGLGHRVRG